MGHDIGISDWILEAMKEIRTARMVDLINFHANLNGMFQGEKRKVLLDNMVKSLREIVRCTEKRKMRVMLVIKRMNSNIEQ